MNILVCFKLIPDFLMLPEQAWQADQNLAIDFSFAKKNINCFDESAAELALQLQDAAANKKNIVLSALTVSAPGGEVHLKQFMALGFAAQRVDFPVKIDLRFNPLAIAQIIAAYQRIAPQSLILLGMQNGEGNNMQTGLLLAELLGWPCLTQVTRIRQSESDQQINLTRQTGQGEQQLSIKTPAVLVVGNAPDAPSLRAATMMQRLAVQQQNSRVYSVAELGLDWQGLQAKSDQLLLSLVRQNTRRAQRVIEGKSAAEKAQQLYQDYLKERLSQ